ncbi:MAG: squalene/phytoene synthase family protein [Hyphomicrobium sp.]
MGARDEAASDATRAAARRGEPDRFLAALLAPRAARDDLIAIAALSADVRRIAADVSDAPLAEIKMRWLADAVGGAMTAEKSGHPVVDAAGEALSRGGVAQSLVDDFFAAHAHRLYADAPPDNAALKLELEMTEGALFRMAAAVLRVTTTDAADEAISHAAIAYGLARTGLDLPVRLARGGSPLPPSWFGSDAAPDWKAAMRGLTNESRGALQACRSALHGCPAGLITALLPLAVVEPYLAALQRPDHDPARDMAEIAPLMRVWRIGRASATGRI